MPRWSESSLCPFSHLSPSPNTVRHLLCSGGMFPLPLGRGKVGTGEKPVTSAPMFTPTPALPRRGGGSQAAHGKSLTATCVPNSVPPRPQGVGDLTLSADVYPHKNRYRCVQMAYRDVAWRFQMC
jgi:hypothetical protein